MLTKRGKQIVEMEVSQDIGEARNHAINLSVPLCFRSVAALA